MQAVVEVNPKKLGGVPCFAGTRVPVAYLFIHLAHGGTVDSFVEDYDSVSRELAVSLVQALGEALNETSWGARKGCSASWTGWPGCMLA